MGYRGSSNYDERDKLYERSQQEKPIHNSQVKKDLEGLFNKPKKVELCTQGHAWIRDWDGQYKCVRCKTPKPASAFPKP